MRTLQIVLALLSPLIILGTFLAIVEVIGKFLMWWDRRQYERGH